MPTTINLAISAVMLLTGHPGIAALYLGKAVRAGRKASK